MSALAANADELRAVTQAAAREFTTPPRRAAALTYLRQRGIDTVRVPDEWPLGYAPAEWTRLVGVLRGQFSKDTLLATGLARLSSRGSLIDAFRDRVIFPIHSYDGPIAGFIGRDQSGHPGAPKYLNSASNDLFSKGELLFGDVEHALSDGAPHHAQPVLVEGPIDVLALAARCRSEHADSLLPLAASGTAVTAVQIERLASLAAASRTPVVIAFDADPAGRAAALRTGYELRRYGVDVKVAALPQGSDPASYLAQPGSGLSLFTAADAIPLLAVTVETAVAAQGDRMQWIEGRLAAARTTTADLATYPASYAARQIGWIASALRLDTAVMTDELADAYRRVDGVGRVAAQACPVGSIEVLP